MKHCIRFGRKYWGAPRDILRWDKDYCVWLCQQDWFKRKHEEDHQWIIQNIATFTTNPNDPYHMNPFDFEIPRETIYRCVDLKIYPEKVKACKSIEDLQLLISSKSQRSLNLIEIMQMIHEKKEALI